MVYHYFRLTNNVFEKSTSEIMFKIWQRFSLEFLNQFQILLSVISDGLTMSVRFLKKIHSVDF